jgi:hypothetical protein
VVTTFTGKTSPFDDTSAAAGTSYLYWVVALNGSCAGADSSCATGVRLTSPTPAITGASENVCPALTVLLSTDSGMAGYQWYESGSPILGAQSSSFAVAATGSYTVSYTNGSGCSGTSQAHAVTIQLCVPLESAPGDTPATSQSWTDKDTHTWPANLQAASYIVYRGTLGDLPNLLDTNLDSCTKYTGAATSIPVTDDPSIVPGGFYWYLVTGVNGAGEGTAGNATAGERIVNTTGTCAL